MALASLAVLIYFIHHIAQMIQTDNLIATVAVDLQAAFTTLFPEEIGETQRPELNLAPDHWKQARDIFSRENGYVQRVDEKALMALADAARPPNQARAAAGRFRLPPRAHPARAAAGPPDRGDRGRAARLRRHRLAPHAAPGSPLLAAATRRDRGARAFARHQRALHGHGLPRLDRQRAAFRRRALACPRRSGSTRKAACACWRGR